jgi:hypothetical protein
MAKTKIHLPAHPPPAPAPAPRLAGQALTAAGELLVVGVFAVGLAAIASWGLAQHDKVGRGAAASPGPPSGWVCWSDRWGDVCERPHRLSRLPPSRSPY